MWKRQFTAKEFFYHVAHTASSFYTFGESVSNDLRT